MKDKTSNCAEDNPPAEAATGLASATGNGEGLTTTTGAGPTTGVSVAQAVTLHTDLPAPTEPAASTGATVVELSHSHA